MRPSRSQALLDYSLQAVRSRPLHASAWLSNADSHGNGNHGKDDSSSNDSGPATDKPVSTPAGSSEAAKDVEDATQKSGVTRPSGAETGEANDRDRAIESGGNDNSGTSSAADGQQGSDAASSDGGQSSSKDGSDDDEGTAINSLVQTGSGFRGSGSGSSLFQPSVPEYYPEVFALPIARRPLFPHYMRTVQVVDPKIASAIARMKKRGQPYLGVFLTRDDKNEKDSIKDLSDVYPVGTFASVMQTQPFDNGGAMVLLMPHRRIRATEILRSDPFTAVKVDNLITEPYNKNSAIIKALTQEIISTIKDIAKMSQFFREQLAQAHYLLTNSNFFDDPAQLADFAAGITNAESHDLQAVLEELVIEERLRKAIVLLKKELIYAKVQHEIGKEVEDKISSRQREYFLNEMLKSIKKELGIEKDDKEALVQKFRQKAAQRHMPEYAQKVFEEELKKLSVLETASSEFNVTRNYLDWLTALPWGVRSQENLDTAHAARVLDEDHYGLGDVKERILEFIAVGKLRGTVQGKILCLVGPPGVGKTSIGKSIARTLNREFFRFSVGGLTDIAEIKGHRRTYVGAMPGKLVQCLKKTQTENPLVLIDEIDKIGRGWNGDPSSALLEMLDPEQNEAFLDHYLDVPVDLSKVLFVCTANVTDTIPAPLLDRMEVIRLSGYIGEEKVAIAEQYLIPNAMKASGLEPADARLAREGVDGLIRQYCREAGVRNLQKHIDKVFRKVALRKVKGELPDGGVTVTEKNLPDFVGKPVYTTDRLYDHTPVGVVMGLAWTSMGGSTLYIEAALKDEGVDKENVKAGLLTTGQMGEVMKESSTIAYSFSRAFLHKRVPDNHFFRTAAIHMHVPEGATPKDGPSAGITMVTALLSLALQRPARTDIAMTGEITLTGRVLRIGGVKEKTIAAKRSGVRTLIFPAANRADWEELPSDVRAGLTVHFAETYDDVFPLVFGDAQ